MILLINVLLYTQCTRKEIKSHQIGLTSRCEHCLDTAFFPCLHQVRVIRQNLLSNSASPALSIRPAGMRLNQTNEEYRHRNHSVGLISVLCHRLRVKDTGLAGRSKDGTQ